MCNFFCPCVCSLPNDVSSGTTVALSKHKLLLPFVLVSLKKNSHQHSQSAHKFLGWRQVNAESECHWPERDFSRRFVCCLINEHVTLYNRGVWLRRRLANSTQLVFSQVHLREHPAGIPREVVRSSKPAWFITHCTRAASLTVRGLI